MSPPRMELSPHPSEVDVSAGDDDSEVDWGGEDRVGDEAIGGGGGGGETKCGLRR